MRITLQRVSKAGVTIDGQCIASIRNGLLLFVGFGKCDMDDLEEKIAKACSKIVGLRVFQNHQGSLTNRLPT